MTVTFETLCAYIEQELQTKQPFILAIDGNSASGKTTLACRLADRFGGDVIHMDDFFLPFSLRTYERLQEPGGNVHYERFYEQIIKPLQSGTTSFCWQRFECSSGNYASELCRIENPSLIIIEGAYSMRPEFRQAYDMTLFLCAGPETQKERIQHRNGSEKLHAFLEKWIPMENKYFEYYKIPEQCRFIFNTDFCPNNTSPCIR